MTEMWATLMGGILVILMALPNILLYVHDRKNKFNLIVGVFTIIIVLVSLYYVFYIYQPTEWGMMTIFGPTVRFFIC